jgi:hypothetical protein
VRDIQFALVREGQSDDGLAVLIRVLLSRSVVPGVIGASRNYQGSTKQKLAQVLAEDIVPDLIFIHRDSDSRDSTGRHAEITSAAIELGCESKVVAIVPVQETEAWLLTEESAIREVVGRPSGKAPLGCPRSSASKTLPTRRKYSNRRAESPAKNAAPASNQPPVNFPGIGLPCSNASTSTAL